MAATKRKGARSTKEIPTDILQQLNKGGIETANLVEWLAVDQKLLLENLLRQNKRTDYLKPIFAKIDRLKKQMVNAINEAIGTELFEQTTKITTKSSWQLCQIIMPTLSVVGQLIQSEKSKTITCKSN